MRQISNDKKFMRRTNLYLTNNFSPLESDDCEVQACYLMIYNPLRNLDSLKGIRYWQL